MFSKNFLSKKGVKKKKETKNILKNNQLIEFKKMKELIVFFLPSVILYFLT